VLINESKTVPSITLDVTQHCAFAGETAIPITPTEFRLLSVFVADPGRAFSRAELISAALSDAIVSERTIDAHVGALRKKKMALCVGIDRVAHSIIE
jgi:two-component system phosphate regulon response regulator PhoB